MDSNFMQGYYGGPDPEKIKLLSDLKSQAGNYSLDDFTDTPTDTVPKIASLQDPSLMPPSNPAVPQQGFSSWEQEYLNKLGQLPAQAEEWRKKANTAYQEMQDEYKTAADGQKKTLGQSLGDLVLGLGDSYLASLPGRYATAGGTPDISGQLDSLRQYQQLREQRGSRTQQQQMEKLKALQEYRRQMLGMDQQVFQANQQSQLEGAKFAMEAARRSDEINRQERHWQEQMALHRASLAQAAQARQDQLELRKAMLDAKDKDKDPWWKDNFENNAKSLNNADVKLNSQSGDFSKEMDALSDLSKEFANRGALDQAADYVYRNFKNAAPGWARGLFGDKTTPEQQLSLLRTALKARAESFKDMPGIDVGALVDKINNGNAIDVANAAGYLNSLLKNSQNRFAQFTKNPQMTPHDYLNIPNTVTWEDIAPKAQQDNKSTVDKLTSGDFQGVKSDLATTIRDWGENPPKFNLPAVAAPKAGTIKVPVLDDKGNPKMMEMAPEQYSKYQDSIIGKILGGK